MARSEADMISKAPITLRLGLKDYEVPPLTVLLARQWRLKLDASIGDIVRNFQAVPGADTKAFATGLTGALIQFPEKLAELLFAYANGWAEADSPGKPRLTTPVLPEDEILANATEEQLASAFSGVMAMAYPFLPQLAMVRQAVLGSLAQTANSTRLQ